MLPENTKSRFTINTSRYASVSVNLTGVSQDIVIVNYRHTDQDLDPIASRVFNQLVHLDNALLSHFASLTQAHSHRVDLTVYPSEVSTGATKYLFVFSLQNQNIYQVELTNEDLESERMLRRVLETILYALLFHFKSTQTTENWYRRSPIQRGRGDGRSYRFEGPYRDNELTRGRR